MARPSNEVPLYNPNPPPRTGNDELERYLSEELWRIEQAILQANGGGVTEALTAAQNGNAVNKFGENPDVDTTTTPEDIWDVGGTYTFMTAAGTIRFNSTSANDIDTTGTGARKIQVEGLDGNFQYQSEIVNMNGTGIVDTANTYIRMFRAKVVEAGSSGVNEGAISGLSVSGTPILATQVSILANQGQSLMAIYTVPAGRVAYMTNFGVSLNRASIAAGAMMDVSLRARDNTLTGTPVNIKHTVNMAVDGTSVTEVRFNPYNRFTEKTDLWLRVDSVTDNNTGVSGWFDLILE